MASKRGKEDNFLKEFMAFKSDWDQEVKQRGTDLESLATSAQTKPKPQAKVTQNKVNNFATPSGTARLTEKNLKKMQVAIAYDEKLKPLQVEKTAKFSKDSRFKAPQVDDRQLLYPSIDFARQTYHASKTAIRPKIHDKDAIEKAETATQASTAATSAFGDKGGSPMKPAKGVVIAKISALSDEQLERLLRAQFQKNVKTLTKNVIISNVKFNAVEKNVRGPRLTSKKNESRLKIQEMWQERRGPTMMTYNPREEIVRPDLPVAKFPDDERPFNKSPRGDFRRPLDPNLDAIRKVAPSITVAPEHEMVVSEMIKDFVQTKNGPATYTPQFGLVEARADVGIPKFRSEYFEKVEEEDTQVDLYPNFNVNKPNKLVFKYYQPTVQKPANIPDSEANPGRWVFYDVDLDVVREELAKNIFMGAKNETKEEFAEREEFQRLLEEHIVRIHKKVPEHGDYDKPHQEHEIPGVNVEFSKQMGREGPRETDDMDDQEGDVLILDPEKLQKRLPNINFEKQLGRPEAVIDELDDIEGDVLDLEPMRPEKRIAEINFDKQIGRPDPRTLEDDDVFIRDFTDEPIPNDPSVLKVVAHNFGLAGDRFDHEKERLNDELDLGQDEVFLDPQLPERKLKGTVMMDKGEERFKERLNPDPFYDEQPINELKIDVYAALEKAIKPHVAVPDFKRYTNAGKDKNITAVVEEEDKKDKKKTENIAKAKTSYGVGTVFKGAGMAAKKKKAAAAKKKQQNKPKQGIESAQEEVERYMAELGLN